MRFFLVTLLLLMSLASAQAGQVEIVQAEFEAAASSWTVRVTLLHDDNGWDHYADAWRVVDEDGNELGVRTLYHPHENEQPFTRSLSGVSIPASTKIVYVEAHDKVHGWSKQRVRVDLTKSTGERYSVRTP